MKYGPLTVVAGIAMLVSGCSLLPGNNQPPPAQSQTGDARLDRLNEGYSLLYGSVSGLGITDKILLIKFESARTQSLVSDIAEHARMLTARLQGLPERYPALRIDLQPLPEVERLKQGAARQARALSFAPLVGRTGPDFERTLLLTLSGGLNQLRFLAQVVAEEERNADRQQLLGDAQASFRSQYKRSLKLLNDEFYVHNSYDPEAF